MDAATTQLPMGRRCGTCGRLRSALLDVCPDDGARLDAVPVELPPSEERSISIDLVTRTPAGPLASDSTVDAALPSGARVGDYVIESVLGAGGGGTVYRAAHAGIGKRAAIKVIHRALALSQSAVQRFLDEARTVNAINHPSLVDIYATGSLPDGRPYLVMELLDGRPLSMALREGTLSATDKLRIVDQVCVVLEAAHQKGVVHRDLKPDNIFLVGEGAALRVKLLDFGVAKLLDPGSGSARERTQTGVVMGTPVYMSPEQILGDQIGPPSDVYSLGVVLYRLFTGRPPFLADTTVELFMHHLHKAAPLPDELSPLVPLRLSRQMHQMLAKNPANRPSLTTVRAAALATLFPNSKLAAAMPTQAPRRPELEPARPAVPEERPSGNALWLIGGVSASVVVGALALLRTPAEPRPASPVVSPSPVLAPAPVAPPAPELPRPVIRLTDARVQVTVFPKNAEVRFDQQKVATADGVAVVYAAPGPKHELVVSAPGYTPHTRTLDLAPEQRLEYAVTLEAVPAHAPEPQVRVSPRPAASKKKPRDELIDPF